MGGGKYFWEFKTLGLRIALGCIAVAVLIVVVAPSGDPDPAPDNGAGRISPAEARFARDIETGPARSGAYAPSDGKAALAESESDLPMSEPQPPSAPAPDSGGWNPVVNDEALPCTGPRQPVNFENFSAGPSVDGLPLTYTERRCGGGPVATRVNYVSYIYGDCEIAESATGCQPPLEIQTWPACQRYLAKYSFRGEPLPHRRLEKRDGAEVVEFNFALDKRIEVYTKEVTVVIFATDRSLATRAVEMLRSEEKRDPPAAQPDELERDAVGQLGSPAGGAMKGELSCQV